MKYFLFSKTISLLFIPWARKKRRTRINAPDTKQIELVVGKRTSVMPCLSKACNYFVSKPGRKIHFPPAFVVIATLIPFGMLNIQSDLGHFFKPLVLNLFGKFNIYVGHDFLTENYVISVVIWYQARSLIHACNFL